MIHSLWLPIPFFFFNLVDAGHNASINIEKEIKELKENSLKSRPKLVLFHSAIHL